MASPLYGVLEVGGKMRSLAGAGEAIAEIATETHTLRMTVWENGEFVVDRIPKRWSAARKAAVKEWEVLREGAVGVVEASVDEDCDFCADPAPDPTPMVEKDFFNEAVDYR